MSLEWTVIAHVGLLSEVSPSLCRTCHEHRTLLMAVPLVIVDNRD
jgi:hypothetical protein